MKSKLLISSLFVSSFFAATANAADGTINFSGEVIQNACKVHGDSANQNVIMGVVSADAFKKVNDTAAPTRFQIKLVDCPEEMKQNNIAIKFDGPSDSDNRELLALTKIDNAASGVAIGIYEADTQTRVSIAGDSENNLLHKGAGQELNFLAKYVATKEKVGPGSANAVTNFTVVYN
ncbi:putative fimbrial subunit protein [Xenorhabdus beddingii]|uniref:Putative fimbrial subunit protein n=1 Tax=Xenorhabdus beddingii TaxID=40578 RepID=A0A1Y2SQ39_9GAMM|nr:fimbrial protein [Xenorhabdus beddingii]OTA21185.1 putative fimbrial subunit protein [Xenorhabdus beddingii]